MIRHSLYSETAGTRGSNYTAHWVRPLLKAAVFGHLRHDRPPGLKHRFAVGKAPDQKVAVFPHAGSKCIKVLREIVAVAELAYVAARELETAAALVDHFRKTGTIAVPPLGRQVDLVSAARP